MSQTAIVNKYSQVSNRVVFSKYGMLLSIKLISYCNMSNIEIIKQAEDIEFVVIEASCCFSKVTWLFD